MTESIPRLDRYAYCAGAILTAFVLVELGHRYWLPVLDVGYRAAERATERWGH